MQKFTRFFKYDASLSLEKNIFRIILILAILILIVFIPVSFLVEIPILGWSFIVGVGVYSWIYYLAFKRNEFKLANTLMFVLTLILISIYYFLSAGLTGRTWLYYIIVGMLTPFLFKNRKTQIVSVLIVVLVMVSVSLFELWYPDYIINYPNRGDMFLGVILTQVVTTFALFILMKTVKQNYDRVSRKLLVKEQVLKRKNKTLSRYLRELEKKNHQLTQLNESKNHLFSIISHDIRSPLSSSKSLVELAYQGDYPIEGLKELLPDVYRNLSYTLGLVDNLLSWAKEQMMQSSVEVAKSTKQIIVNKFLTRTVENMEILVKQKELSLHLSLQNTEGVKISCNEDDLAVVLRNLICNAIKFSYPNGKIYIATAITKEHLQISVQDEGSGISIENLAKIRKGVLFSSKGTLNEKGTGLGLSLVQSLIKKCGGFLDIESEENKGTKVTIFLPAKVIQAAGVIQVGGGGIYLKKQTKYNN